VKINELELQEGVFDKLAAGVAGAKAGLQAGGDARQGTAQQQEVAREFINRWNQAVAQDPSIATPDSLKQFMHNSTRKSGITVPEPPATINNAAVAQYITKVMGQSMAARRLGLQPAEQPGAETPAGAAAPADAKAAPAAPTLTPGFTMTDDDPVTIKYKKQDYVRNDEGYWAPLSAPTKPITDSATSKIFDKQEQAIENWKAAQAGTAPPAPKSTPAAPPPTDASADADTGTSADAATSSPVKPDDRTAKELLSPSGIKDTETEVFIPGHGIVQKQQDGSWRSLPKKAPINKADWAALDQRLEAAKAAAPAAAPADEPEATDVAGTSLPGAPIRSKVEVSGGGVSVGFEKGDEGWRNIDPAKALTTHKPGTKAYDALERQWARMNGKPEPTPTVGTTTTTPTPTPAPEPATAMTESFKRLNRITHGKI